MQFLREWEVVQTSADEQELIPTVWFLREWLH
jgi:hypothetical protein